MSCPIPGPFPRLRAQALGRAHAVKTGRFVRRGEPTSSLIILIIQQPNNPNNNVRAGCSPAGRLFGAACLKSRAGLDLTAGRDVPRPSRLPSSR